jgi:hypothetical protein
VPYRESGQLAITLRTTEVTTRRVVPPLIFVPPAFDLYEFDAGALSVAAGPARRWFRNWNGPIGAPAEEVTLGWSAGGATVLVGTRGQQRHEEWARHEAAHLLLAGDDVSLPSRPASPGAVHRELRRIMSAGGLWSPAPALFAGGPAAETAVLDGFALAYCLVGAGAICLAAVGVRPGEFRIRIVRDWTAYDHDASTRFPLSDPKR